MATSLASLFCSVKAKLQSCVCAFLCFWIHGVTPQQYKNSLLAQMSLAEVNLRNLSVTELVQELL